MRSARSRVHLRCAFRTAAVLLVVGCAGPVATPSSPAHSALPGAAVGPIGAWTTTLSEADLRAGGISDEATIRENIGTFTFTATEGGTWTIAQQASHPIRWPVFRGTWTAPTAGMITITTEFPEDYAGEFAMLSWSIDAGGLHVVVLTPRDPLLEAQWESHPWVPLP